MALRRNAVFNVLGVKPTNPRWAWCAKSEYLAVFTLWDDEMLEGDTWHLHDEKSKLENRPGYRDLKAVLKETIRINIPALGILCYPKDVAADPRSIKKIDEKVFIKLKLYENSVGIFAKKIGEISYTEQISSITTKKKNDGLRDLEFIPAGNNVPDRARRIGYTIQRDQKVRNFIINQAKGMCEYCGNGSFEMKGGLYFLEAHHIIALAKNGKDTIDNVIALCPNHHREAHFGINAEELEKVLVEKVKERNGLIVAP